MVNYLIHYNSFFDAEIPQEDGTDKTETVDESKNLAQVSAQRAVRWHASALTPWPAGSKPAQGMRINQVKYQIIRSVVDEASNCFSVHGKKVPTAFMYVCYVVPVCMYVCMS